MLKDLISLFQKDLKEEPSVVIFEKDLSLHDLLKECLLHEGIKNFRFLFEERALFQQLQEETPTILIYDYEVFENGQQVYTFLTQLKNLFPNLKIFLIIPYEKEINLGDLFFAGADEVLQKPFRLGDFLARFIKVLRTYYLEQRLLQLLTEDPLTYAYNRRYFETAIREEAIRALRYNIPLSLLMIDLDNFKKYNDTFGHTEGDKVLQGVALLFCECVRIKIDKVCRYGGDEFIIILPHTDWVKAVNITKRIISQYEKSSFDPVTLSIGVAQLIDRGEVEKSVSDLINRADQAMYEAKKISGNSFVVDPETMSKFPAAEVQPEDQSSPGLPSPSPQVLPEKNYPAPRP